AGRLRRVRETRQGSSTLRGRAFASCGTHTGDPLDLRVQGAYMRTTLRQRLWIAALVAVACVALRLTLLAGQPSQKSAAVRIVPAGQRAGGNPGQKGATYYALEGQTKRLTTSFADGTKAVAERAVDGNLGTR